MVLDASYSTTAAGSMGAEAPSELSAACQTGVSQVPRIVSLVLTPPNACKARCVSLDTPAPATLHGGEVTAIPRCSAHANYCTEFCHRARRPPSAKCRPFARLLRLLTLSRLASHYRGARTSHPTGGLSTATMHARRILQRHGTKSSSARSTMTLSGHRRDPLPRGCYSLPPRRNIVYPGWRALCE